MTGRVYGVDFSGAQNAHRKIWVSKGSIEDDLVKISDCYQLGDRTDAHDLGSAMQELVEIISTDTPDIVGIDAPFGVPEEAANDSSWGDLVEIVRDGGECSSPADFKKWCTENAADNLLLRETDAMCNGQSPYHQHIYKQTYYVINDILAELRGKASIVPMERKENAATTVVEVFPRVTLVAEPDLYSTGYKGTGERERERREKILERLADGSRMEIEERESAVDDSHGDGVDSIVAAFAASRAFRSESELVDEVPPSEGYIHV